MRHREEAIEETLAGCWMSMPTFAENYMADSGDQRSKD